MFDHYMQFKVNTNKYFSIFFEFKLYKYYWNIREFSVLTDFLHKNIRKYNYNGYEMCFKHCIDRNLTWMCNLKLIQRVFFRNFCNLSFLRILR